MSEYVKDYLEMLEHRNIIKVRTESGTFYEIAADLSSVRRLSPNAAMRRDNEWLKVTEMGEIALGQPLIFMLEPLGEGDVTLRRTTPVVSIEE